MPTALWGLSQSEQLHRALPVLEAARRDVVAGDDPLNAIAQAGRSGIECEYARRALRLVLFEWNLLSWQESKGLRKSDKTRAFDRAIRLCRRVKGRKGGWRVSAAIEAKHRAAVGAP